MNRERESDEASAREGRRYYNPGQKDFATFLKTSDETGGRMTLIEIEVAPGGGTPPHYHKTYDEHFEVLGGALDVLLGKEKHTLRPGQRAVAPKNTLHCFKNPTGEPTTFLVEMRPGQPGFEKAVKAGYGMAARGRNPMYHPYQLAVILDWSEIRMTGLLGLFDPVFRLLAKRARNKGVDKELEAEYCR
jgi:mannose-6-phosphate isomerase-like protein (cupin superfamily)